MSAVKPPTSMIKTPIELGVVKLLICFENFLVVSPVVFMVPPSKYGSHTQINSDICRIIDAVQFQKISNALITRRVGNSKAKIFKANHKPVLE